MAKVTDPASVGDTLLLGPKKELPVKFKPLPHFPSKPDKEPPAKFKPLPRLPSKPDTSTVKTVSAPKSPKEMTSKVRRPSFSEVAKSITLQDSRRMSGSSTHPTTLWDHTAKHSPRVACSRQTIQSPVEGTSFDAAEDLESLVAIAKMKSSKSVLKDTKMSAKTLEDDSEDVSNSSPTLLGAAVDKPRVKVFMRCKKTTGSSCSSPSLDPSKQLKHFQRLCKRTLPLLPDEASKAPCIASSEKMHVPPLDSGKERSIKTIQSTKSLRLTRTAITATSSYSSSSGRFDAVAKPKKVLTDLSESDDDSATLRSGVTSYPSTTGFCSRR